MKTFIFSALALGMMASCSNSEIDEIIDNGEPVAIQLSAGVETTTILSRAAIVDNEKFNAIVLGWESTTVPTTYEVNPAWNAETTDISTSGTTEAVTVTNQYYRAEEGYKTYMRAFYVDGAIATKESEEKAWNYNLDKKDGSVDILLTTDVAIGDKTTPATSLEFVHPLTKLIFNVQAGVGLATDVKLESIKLLNVGVPENINLGTNTVGFTAIGELNVPVTLTDAITGTSTVATTAVMVEPVTGTFKIAVKTNKKEYTDITVTLDAVADHTDGAGVAYIVTLTFRDNISSKAEVTQWAAGTGSGIIG